MYGPCFSSIVGGHPLRSPTRHRLGKPLPYQLADGTQAPPEANYSFYHQASNPNDHMRYYQSFRTVIPHFGAGHQRVTHPFAARSVLLHSPLDLHVLGTPPAFILSQDQTLRNIFITFAGALFFLRFFFLRRAHFLPTTLQLLKFRYFLFFGPLLFSRLRYRQGQGINLPTFL